MSKYFKRVTRQAACTQFKLFLASQNYDNFPALHRTQHTLLKIVKNEGSYLLLAADRFPNADVGMIIGLFII